jgi:ferric-dicitrate binding protein FerR (iron transport regulator)
MKDTRPVKEYITAYFLQEDTTEISPELKEWLNEKVENRLEFEAYRKIWNEIRNIYIMKNFDAKAAWIKVNEANRRHAVLKKRRSRIIHTASGIAASVLLFVALSTSGFLRHTRLPVTAVEMETDNGSRSNMILPDGTHVRLNSGSKISYAFNQKEKIREVAFSGEGFFEVSKDENPFIITTSDELQLKVLGTTFNLSAYKGDETIETTLIEGTVEMGRNGHKLVLKPGETGSYDKTKNTLQQISKISSHTYGWINDKIYMDDMPLVELCKQLERMYDVNITLQGEIGEKIRYNGVVHEESIADVLDALQKLSKINYKMKGKNITINSK